MANNIDLTMRLLAEDKASAQLAKVGKSTDALTKKQQMLGKAVGAVSALAVIAFAKQSIQAYAGAEAAQVKLEGAYKRFPKLADASISSLRELNTAMQAKTGFDDDAIASSQAVLAQFNLTGQQVKNVTPLLLDYARATGQDVTLAAESFGKALLGNTRALKTIGIDYKMTGDSAKDFANIQDLVRQKVGGAAEEFGGTTAGKLEILNATYGDLQETIGEALVPALTSLTDVATTGLQVFNALPGPVRSYGLAVGVAGAAALAMTGKVVALNTALIGAGPAGAKAAAGLRTFGAAGAAVGVVYALGEGVAKLNDYFGQGANDVTTWSNELSDGFDSEEIQRIAKAIAGPQDGFLGAIDKFSRLDVGGGIAALRNGSDEVSNFDTALSDMVSSGNTARAQQLVGQLGLSADDAASKLPQYTAALTTNTSAVSSAIGPQGALNDEVDDGAKKFTSLADAIHSAIDPILSLDKARIALKGGLADLTKTLKENGDSIDINTEKGRANRSAVLAQVDTVVDFASATEAAAKKRGASDEDAAAKAAAAYNQQIGGIKRVMRQLGFNQGEIDKVAGKWRSLPKKVTTEYQVTATLSGVQQVTAGVGRMAGIHVPGGTITKAGGGWISGPGTSTSDSVLARLSDGEFVTNAAASAKHGALLEAINADGYASGGKAKRDRARSRLSSLQSGRASTISGSSDSLRSFASVLGFDTGAAAQAVDALTQALENQAAAAGDVTDARRALNAVKPGDDAGRAAALQAVAAAQAKVAAADKAAASARKDVAATAVTGKNILGDMRARASKITALGGVLKKLAAKGLNSTTLLDIAKQGAQDPEAATTFANALLSTAGGIGQTNTLQRQINAGSAAVASFTGNVEYGPRLNRAAARVADLSKRGDNMVVELYLDGKALHGSLVKLKKRRGGKALGLA